MTDDKHIIIRLEQIKEALQENRAVYINNGVPVSKSPTLSEWAAEEIVCVLLDILQDESEPCELFGEVEE